MTTQAQIDANRQNAKKSTGPKTPEGKDKVAQNAIKHGLLARRFFIGPDQQQDFARFCDTIRDDLTPAGPLQSVLADRIADLAWRLDQCQTIRDSILNAMVAKTMRFPNSSYRPQTFESEQEVENYLLASTVISDFAGIRVLDKLSIYEQRIERGLIAAQKEYRALRAFRAKEAIIKAKLMDIGDDADYRADTPPVPRQRRREQTKPIWMRDTFTTPLPQRPNGAYPDFAADKTNPNQMPSDPTRPAFHPQSDPLRTPQSF